jgi:hypothetical protein
MIVEPTPAPDKNIGMEIVTGPVDQEQLPAGIIMVSPILALFTAD